MKGRTAKIVLSAVMALTIVSAGTVIAPVGDVIGGLTVSVSAATVDSGDFGTNNALHWEYDDSSVLTITGTGAMPDYTHKTSDSAPWFQYRESIKEIVIGSGITHIGRFAFFYTTEPNNYQSSKGTKRYSALERVIISDTVTSIGTNAFRWCDKLNYVNIFDEDANDTCTVDFIGGGAFYRCNSLKKVNIPASVRTMTYDGNYNTSSNPNGGGGYGVFNYCSGLEEVVIENGIVDIDDSIFSSCTSLHSVSIPASVSSMGVRIFYNCGEGMEITEGAEVRLNADHFMKKVGEGGDSRARVISITQPGLSDADLKKYFAFLPNVVVNGQIAVELNLNGGSFVNDGVEASYIAAIGAELPDVVKEGAIFNGWYDNEALTGDPVTAVPDDAKGTMEYWAKWDDEIKFTGASLTLADDMALNFAVNGITADNCGDYTVRFEGKSVNDTSNLELIDGRYCAVAHVYPKNIDETITATLYEGEDQVGDPLDYSITDYLNTVASGNGYTSAEQDLARATMLFGAAAAEYFYGGDHVYDDLFEDYLMLANTPADDEDIASATSGHAFDNADAKISVVLDNKTSVCVYIKGVAAGTTAGGYTSIASNSTMKKQGYPSYFEISGLTPDQLRAKTTIVVDDKTYEFSALSWAHRVLNSGLPDDNKNVKLAKALVIYALEAESYNGTHN